MTICNNGEIYFSQELTEEQKSIIVNLFSDGSEDVSFSDDGLTLTFEDFYGSDLTSELNIMLSYCEEWGIKIDETSNISYFGDYDGCYQIVDGQFYDMDLGDAGVANASAFQLKEELARREGKICIPLNNYAQSVSLTPEEAEAVYEYIQKEHLRDDALTAIERYCENNDTRTERYKELCEQYHSVKRPAHAVLRNGSLVAKIVGFFEEHNTADFAPNSIWEDAVEAVFYEGERH